jgi:predicted transposase YbfD/YdcC
MIEQAMPATLEAHFGDLPDPRVTGRCRYRLLDLIVMTICASLTGAQNWVEVEAFVYSKRDWLQGFMNLDETLPSHDTFGRVFAMLDAQAFHTRFASWVRAVFEQTEGQVVAIDGKTARRSHDRGIGQDALHTVSAWGCANGLVLGQIATDAKSNEITAIPQLLQLLDVSGCLVTIDAMGTQKKITQQIRQQGGDYLLSLKDNQERLHQTAQDLFAYGDQTAFRHLQHSYHETINKGHGRIEIRRCDALALDDLLASFRDEGWRDLKTLVRVQRERRIGDRVETQTVYYISSTSNDARRLLAASRSHWGVENSLHWVLDVIFDEDQARTRRGYSAENMGIVRHVTLNILKQHQSKHSLKVKRYKAAMDNTFLEGLLACI